MTKRIISIALALCLIISFAAITAYAADTDKAKTAGQTISVDVSNCDTPADPTSWYIWTWADGQNGRLVDGHGEDAYNVYFDDCDSNVVIVRCPFGEKPNDNWSNVWNKSGDEKARGNHATVYWGDAVGAPLKVDWSNSSDSDGGSGSYDNQDNYNDDMYSGCTVFLDPGDASGEWYAYTWKDDAHKWVSGSEENGKYKFTGLMDNVIFATTSGYPADDWSNVSMQSEDLSAQEGMTFTVSGTVESTGLSGEPMTKYGGDWGDSTGNVDSGDNTWQNPDDDQGQTQDDNQWQYPVNPAPVDNPPANNQDSGQFTADIKLNGELVRSQPVNGDFCVTYSLTSAETIIDGQATLFFDSSKLSIVSWEFPIVEAAVIDNLSAGDGEACFNFTSPRRPFDFTRGGVLVNVKFRPLASTGTASINLCMEELDSMDTSFITNSVVSPQAATLFGSMKNVTVSDSAGSPMNNPSYVTPEVRPSNPQSATADTNKISGNTVSKAKKANPAKITVKNKAVKRAKLIKKSLKFRAVSVKNAPGKVSLKITATSKKLAKKVKLSQKGVLKLKKCKLKKGIYKVKVKISVGGTNQYAAKKLTKIIKIKVK